MADPTMAAMDRAYAEQETNDAKAIAWQEGFEAGLRWCRDVRAKAEPNPYRETPKPRANKPANRKGSR